MRQQGDDLLLRKDKSHYKLPEKLLMTSHFDDHITFCRGIHGEKMTTITNIWDGVCLVGIEKSSAFDLIWARTNFGISKGPRLKQTSTLDFL